MRRVPLLATLFLLGTFAIAALPPFNGFVSEWLRFLSWRPLAPALVSDLTHIGARIGYGALPLRGLVVLHSGTATPVIFAMSTGLTFVVIAFLLLVVWLLVRGLPRRRLSRGRAWDAGLASLRPDMTCTATAFASPVRVLFDAVLQPVVSTRRYQRGAFVTGLRH